MYPLTQGTVLSGVRSSKYPGTRCNGIIITARCDLYNRKTTKIFYLIAIPFSEWVLSDSGLNVLLSQQRKDLEKKISTIVDKSGLCWDILKNFSTEDFSTVISDKEVGLKKDIGNCLENFTTYKKYSTFNLSQEEKRSILKRESKCISSALMNIVSGQMSHYILVPGMEGTAESPEASLIVDLQELESISISDAEKLARLEIDIKNKMLTDEDKRRLNLSFYLYDSPGYTMPEHDIPSPWIEYIMQHFSNSFIRIGVDTPKKEIITTLLEKIY